MRGLLALQGTPPVPLRGRRRALQPHRPRLNDYIQEHMGEEFSRKDFRTWGGTLIAAIAFAERGPVETHDGAEARRRRRSCARSASSSEIRRPSPATPTSAPPSSSSISTGERSTISARAICAIVTARDIGLDREEQATLSLLRSWRIRERALPREFVAISLASRPYSIEGGNPWPKDRARVRQLRQGSRRRKGRVAPADLSPTPDAAPSRPTSATTAPGKMPGQRRPPAAAGGRSRR